MLNKSGDFEVVPAEPEINSDDDRWDDVYLLSPPSLFHLSSPPSQKQMFDSYKETSGTESQQKKIHWTSRTRFQTKKEKSTTKYRYLSTSF